MNFQSNSLGGFESMACCSFALNNCIEMILKKKYGIVVNLSDRFVAKMSGTTKRGNSMSIVLDGVRKIFGNTKEEKWTWDRDTFTWDEYYKSIPKTILDEARGWILDYCLTYETVPQNVSIMYDALKYSPLYVAGYAWYCEKGLYRSYGSANHCFVIVGAKWGEYWLAYDSYSPFVKKLAWDYKFGAVKAIYVEVADKRLAEIQKLEERGTAYVMRTEGHGEIYRLNTMEKVEIEDVAKDVRENIDSNISQEVVNAIVKRMLEMKLLTPISEKLYEIIKK